MEQNLTVILEQSSGSAAISNLTYAEAIAMELAGTIVPGSKYRLTDFKTLHLIQGTTERNDTNITIDVEVLILTGRNTQSFEKEVSSELFPKDSIHYTTDNSAWKELQATGAKGCITLRIDTLRNIEVGNGDWRNFIVRRWAADLTSSGRGIRWILWSPSMSCGFANNNTGAGQAFVAISTTFYNASTNPSGYKDVRMFLPDYGTDRGTENVRIKAGKDGTNSTFPIPNIHIEKIRYSSARFNNVEIVSCGNATFTDEVYHLNCTTIEWCIFTDVVSYVSGFTGYFQNLFSNANHFATLSMGNINGGSIFIDVLNQRFVGEFANCSGVCISIDAASDTFGDEGLTKIRNSKNLYVTPILDSGKVCCIEDFFYSYIVNDTWQGNNLKDLSPFAEGLTYNKGYSNISAPVDALANVIIPSARSSNSIAIFAGILDMQGFGVVAISTINRYLSNTFNVILRPVVGLTITISQNNVVNGFVQAATLSANGTNGEVIVLTPIGDRWKASN